MALKPDREVVEYDGQFMNELAEAGGVAVASTYGSGHALNERAYVTYAASPSGRVPMGLLMVNMVDYGTKQLKNPYNSDQNLNSKVTLMRKGWAVTNRVYPGVNPAGGDNAFLGQSGFLTNIQGGSFNPRVGRFESTKDEDGYVKVSIQIPL